jgi:hypothetical protein
MNFDTDAIWIGHIAALRFKRARSVKSKQNKTQTRTNKRLNSFEKTEIIPTTEVGLDRFEEFKCSL